MPLIVEVPALTHESATSLIGHRPALCITTHGDRGAAVKPRVSNGLMWVAIVIAIAALLPIVAMTLMVAAVVWIPLVIALAIGAIALAIRARRQT